MNVNDGAIRSKGAQVIVAVPNEWLQLPIMDMLSSRREEFTCVKSLPELYQKVKEYPQCIVIIDIFAFTEYHRDIVERLIQENPCLSLILLVSRDKVAYSQSLDRSDSCYIIPKGEIDKQLLAMMECVHKDQKLMASALNSPTAQVERQLPALIKKEANQMEKENGSIFGRKFGRRSFLKGSAAAAAVAGVAVANPVGTVKKALATGEGNGAGEAQDQIFYGACRGNCLAGCRLKITVRQGKVAKVQMAEVPDKRYNRICAKGLTHVQSVYSAGRLKYPMKRVGERGAGQWEQISWEEAVNAITDQWKKISSESGNSANAFFPGTGNYGTLAGKGFKRLANLMGASTIGPNYDSNLLATLAASIGIGPNYNANDLADMINAKTILFFGVNISEAQVHNWHFAKEAQEKGAKLIAVDPVSTTLAIKSDIHAPIRPGSDPALIMAMINLIIKNGWTDQDFLKKSTVAPFLVKENKTYLRLSDLGKLPEGQPDAIVVRGQDGKVGLPTEITDPVIKGTFTINGIKVTTAYDLLVERVADWTPERAAEVCDLSVDMITDITRIYATETPSTLYTGFGPDHYANGDQAYLGMMTLGMLTGNMGKKGASVGLPANLGFNINAAAISTVPGAVPGPSIPSMKFTDVMETKQLKGQPLEIRSIYHIAGNPLSNHVGRPEYLKAYEKLDLIVVADWRITDTAQYADIILPAAHWFEQEDICNVQQNTYTAFQEKAVEPYFESKSDWNMLRLLAEGMGYGEQFAFTESDMLKMACEGPAPAAFGVSYDKLKSETVMQGTFPLDREYIYGEDGIYGTATGRAQFYIENPQPDFPHDGFDQDKACLPYFEPPIEAWPETVGGYEKNSLAEKYSLIYTSERNKLKTHTMFGHNPWLLELYPEPIVKVNPQDAEKRGIAEGDYVKIYNDRGFVVLKVVFNNGVRPGMVVVPKGWEKDQFKDGHYSDLGSTKTVNNYRLNNNYFDILCEMEKA
ncbi:MAG: molybdopterin-dependent oxidoreductase [Desulfitobacterium hafniense]|uniref:molybdopterin-containing oxidoreductase family protein n=1 Tax=Desulfitobacterium hafniense TaxID=49338 RepID=UPI002B215D36|nr:molybdopterin-dependent oxidoreductase [Desulfitobacterium hafniense]MEA5025602.1 molybdopterin-dependent oxidoreductase [Desulfitobacterium hafniense]